MENKHKYKTPDYELFASLEQSNFHLYLSVLKAGHEGNYDLVVRHNLLTIDLRSQFNNTEDIYEFFGKEKNFQVDFYNRKVYLKVQGSGENQEDRICLTLNKREEEIPYELRFPAIPPPLAKKIQTKNSEDEEFDDYDIQMRNFELKVHEWRRQIGEQSKDFTEEVDFKFEERNGIWKGRYLGELSNGKPHGNGIFIYDFGARIEAEWKNGERNGKCIYFTSEGNIFFSQYKNAKLNGKQIKYFKDGRREEQELVDDFYHGRRRWYRENGQQQREEIWQYDFRTK